jgi:uncharacterized protein
VTEPAFSYRVRGTGPAALQAYAGAEIALDERALYSADFATPLSDREKLLIREMGGEIVNEHLALLSFKNFVGTTTLRGVRLRVASSKLGPEGTARLLEEVSRLSSSLVFGRGTPVALESAAQRSRASPLPYHQIQVLRDSMLRKPAGARLQDFLAAIARHPTRRFERDRPLVSLNRSRRLDSPALRSIFSHVDRLVPVTSGNMGLLANRLAKALTFGHPPRAHFPTHVASPHARLSFDTPENRFAKHVVSEFLNLARRFSADTRLQKSLRGDCAWMVPILEEALSGEHLENRGAVSALTSPSQALLKMEGYRELLGFWSEYTMHQALPLDPGAVSRFLEGRDIATLYEYWTFCKVVEAAVAASGSQVCGPAAVTTDAYEGRLTYGCEVTLSNGVKIAFNRTYTRSRLDAYSTPLRPDVVVTVGDSEYVFDAKYRLDSLGVEESDVDDGDAASTYKRADLYKMHTYRDALSKVKAAFVLYPGTEFTFFEASGNMRTRPEDIEQVDGVGAIPLRPSTAAVSERLKGTLTRVLVSPQAD